MLMPHAEWREISSRADRMMSQLKYKIIDKCAYSATHEVMERLRKTHKLLGEYNRFIHSFRYFCLSLFISFLPIFKCWK